MLGLLFGQDAGPRSFSTLLPHSTMLDAEAGIALLTTPVQPWHTPDVALGLTWALTLRNVQVCDEETCTEMARIHAGVLKMLPLGAAFQTLMLFWPGHAVPAWEALRAGRPAHPMITAQRQAMAQGMPHRHGRMHGRLRLRRVLATLRLPLLDPQVALGHSLPLLDQIHCAATLLGSLLTGIDPLVASTRERLESLAHGIADSLTAAGHGVERLNGERFQQALSQWVDPLQPEVPVFTATDPLRQQVLQQEVQICEGGWRYGTTQEDGRFHEQYRAQVLSLHRLAPQMYPGILCAPRAPLGATPIGLWNAWDGPMSLTTNVGVTSAETELSRLKLKLRLAKLHAAWNVENAAIVKQLERAIERIYLGGGQVAWSRSHVVLWGQAEQLSRGIDDVKRLAGGLHLGFLPEPTPLGATLFLQTLPLGFHPTKPSERCLQRAKRSELDVLACLLLLYGGFQGTQTAGILYLNEIGEPVLTHPYDSMTAPHSVTVGASGAGKTYNNALEVSQLCSLGETVVMLDPLRNNRWLVALWQGTLITLDLDAPTCINPFYGPLTATHGAFIQHILGLAAQGTHEELSTESFRVLGDAVSYHCETWDRTRGESTMSHFMTEVMEPGAFAPRDPEARRLAGELVRKLKPFYGRGLYAGFLDGPNAFTLDPGLTVIELGKLEHYDDLKGVLFFGLVHLIGQHFEDPVRFYTPKHVVVDECWTLANYTRTAAHMDKMIRTGRNDRYAMHFIGQYERDLSGPMGQAIKALAPRRLFLKQDGSEIPRMAKLFELSPVEEQLLHQADKYDGWSTAYLRVGEKEGGLVHILADRATHLAMSQDVTTAQRRDAALVQAGGDRVAAMRILLAEEGLLAPEARTHG